MAGTLVADVLQDGAGNSTAMDNAIYGSAKAWVNFNGITTASIRASYNVSSVTRTGTGSYTISFTNALTDGNYCSLATSVAYANGSTETFATLATYSSTPAQTSSAVYITQIGSGTNSGNSDSSQICVACFR